MALVSGVRFMSTAGTLGCLSLGLEVAFTYQRLVNSGFFSALAAPSWIGLWKSLRRMNSLTLSSKVLVSVGSMPGTLNVPLTKPRFTALKMACMLARMVSLPSSVSLSKRNVQAYLPFDGSTLNTYGKSTTAGCGKMTSSLPYSGLSFCCWLSVMMGTSIS